MIDLLLQGEPAQCRVAVTELDLFVHQLRAAAEELDTAVRTVSGSWHGVAADEFRSRLNGITGEAEELQGKATQLLRALDEFAVALERVRAELEGARIEALLAGLIVQGDVIQPPPTLTTDLPAPAPILGPIASPFGVDHRVEVYWRCHDRVQTARTRERYAHDDLQAAAGAVLREPFLEHWLAKLGLLPSYPGGHGLWGANAALFGASTGADWATKVKYGEFRGLGRCTSIDQISVIPVQTLLRGCGDGHALVRKIGAVVRVSPTATILAFGLPPTQASKLILLSLAQPRQAAGLDRASATAVQAKSIR